MKIIARKDALARGLKRYYTGKPCKHGHIAERLASNGFCFSCAEVKRAGSGDYHKEYSRKWRQENFDRDKEYHRLYYQQNAEFYSRYRMEYGERNRDLLRQKGLRYRERNADKERDRHARYDRENPHIYREKNSRRRARQRNGLCQCCTKEDLRSVYSQASMTGCEVDHVEPLALGGLHCRHNLQLLTPKDHKEKTRSDMARIVESRSATEEAK